MLGQIGRMRMRPGQIRLAVMDRPGGTSSVDGSYIPMRNEITERTAYGVKGRASGVSRFGAPQDSFSNDSSGAEGRIDGRIFGRRNDIYRRMLPGRVRIM